MRVSAHLVILGDRDALRWVLKTELMAFEERRASDAARVDVGDMLLLYSTRGCFHNPTRDRGRVFGRAQATSRVEPLQAPVEVMGRSFPLGCTFDLLALAPRHEGVVLAELVARLAVFPNKAAWSATMRRPLLSLPANDAALIERRLAPLAQNPAQILSTYE